MYNLCIEQIGDSRALNWCFRNTCTYQWDYELNDKYVREPKGSDTTEYKPNTTVTKCSEQDNFPRNVEEIFVECTSFNYTQFILWKMKKNKQKEDTRRISVLFSKLHIVILHDCLHLNEVISYKWFLELLEMKFWIKKPVGFLCCFSFILV